MKKKTKSNILLFIIILLGVFPIPMKHIITVEPTPLEVDTSSIKRPKDIEHNLIDISRLDTIIYVDLKYASTDNFAEFQFYPDFAKPMLHKNTAAKLAAANKEFESMGYRLKLFDGYRPQFYQKELKDRALEINKSWGPYLADPVKGSHHNRGVAVDVTLTDLEGRELNMPSGYDHFGVEAHINYNGCTEEQKNNRELLARIMVKHGFRRISNEWWHFDDIDYAQYPLLNVPFEDFLKFN